MPAGHRPHRADPPRRRQQGRQLRPGREAPRVGPLAVLAQLVAEIDRGDQGGDEVALVAGTGEEAGAADRPQPDPPLGFVDPLVVGPEEDPPRRRSVVLAGAGEAGDGGAGAVGADHQRRPQLAGRRLHANHAGTAAQQAGHARLRPHLRPGLAGSLEQDRVEGDPAYVDHRVAEQPGHAARPDSHLLEGDVGLVDWRRQPVEAVQHPELVEDLHPGRLDAVGRGGVAGEVGPVDQADPHPRLAEQLRQRRAGTAGADDDHVVAIAGRLRTLL